MLEREYNYYNENKKEFLKKYSGKFLLIVAKELIDTFETEAEAYEAALDKGYEVGSFLIQKCSTEDNLTETFLSRAIF